MKKLILLLLLVPMLAFGQGTITLTQQGNYVKFTGLTSAHTSIMPDATGAVYIANLAQVTARNGNLVTFYRTQDKNPVISFRFTELATKLGTSNAFAFVEYLIANGWISPGATSNIDTVGVVSQIDNIVGGNLDTVSVVTKIDQPLFIPDASFKIGTEGGAVAYTSPITITLSGNYPTISSNAQIVFIKYTPSGLSGANYLINGLNGVTLAHAAGVISVNGATTPFASGDVYEVGINAPRLEVDYTLETLKNTTQNSIWTRYTDPSSLTTANDTLTTSWADVGAEIDCRGYTDVILFVTLDINAGLNARLRALGKWESGGTDEYSLQIETVSASDVKIEPEYLEWNTDADQLSIIRVHTGGIPYVQIQTQEGTDGGDDAILTQPIKLVKIWR